VLETTLSSVIAALFVAVIVAAVNHLFKQVKVARLRRQRAEEEGRLLEQLCALSRRRRGTAVLPSKAAKQAGLRHSSEALKRLRDGGYISPTPGRPDYFELTEEGWSRCLKNQNSREVGP
jgi:hypothetical protein